MHGVAAIALMLSAVLTWMAMREARQRRRDAPRFMPGDADGPSVHGLFLARVASGVGIVSTLALLAQWVPIWVLSPCQQ